jgi:DNA polymerase-3 subunit alpha
MQAHLNLHSCYSLLEGLSSPAELVAAAQVDGIPTLALTDHNYLTGAVEFYRACQRASLQPILGLEVDLAWPETNRLVLLAASLAGWSNLCRISSTLLLSGETNPACSLDLLNTHRTDLLALSDDQGDPYGTRLTQLAEIFPDRLYVSLQNPDGTHTAQVRQASELASRLALPVVASHPVYYIEPRQAALQRLAAAIRLNSPLRSLPPQAAAPAGAYFLSPSEMAARFADFPGALLSTPEIASRCQVELPLGVPHLPQVPIPEGMRVTDYLRQQAEAGARQVYGEITPAIQTRLDHELAVIAERGFEPVFLIVKDLLDYARQQDIPTASRGSASSSLVAHCLGITTPDPLALDLYFERFLNPARTTPPDIDTDIDSQGRDRVIQHAFEIYGAERVAMVGTINRFRPRSALADAAKAYELPPGRVRELANALPYGFWARQAAGQEEKTPESPFLDLRRANPQYLALFNDAEALLKLPRHLSVHPGGLVVAPGLLTDLVPVMRSGSKGVTIIQFDLEAVEALGLVKIDLLGIRGLTVLGEVAGAIHSWRRSEFRSRLEVLDKIPADDPETAETVEHGRTIGCFQIESPGMRAILRQLRANSPEDIIAVLALYRPGPWQGGLKDAFVRRFRGEEDTSHIHPALAELLKDTFGVILYQEQVLRIGHGLAGLSLADADLLRRAMSHSPALAGGARVDPGKQMQLLKEKFVAQAEARSGVPADIGAKIWDMMAAFAGYGFPKAHAASYAQVAWRSAWCKTHFPAEFMAAVLANWGGYYSQRAYLNEARRMGLVVRPPHINHAQRQFAVAYPDGSAVLYMGLDQVRDLTGRTQERILRRRPFRSLEEFLARVEPRQQEAENLVKAGALEGLGTIPDLLQSIQPGMRAPGQMSLFPPIEPSAQDWTLEQKAAAQQDILGISLEAHPLELAAAAITAAGAISTIEAAGKVGQRVTVAGVRLSAHRSRTARGEMMMFLSLEDLEGVLDVIVFPDAYRQAQSAVNSNAPLLVTGLVEMDEERGEPLLKAEKVEAILKTIGK